MSRIQYPKKEATMQREPLAIITAIVTFVGIVISGLSDFGVSLTEAQTSTLNKAVIAAVGIFVVLFVRPKVTPYVAPTSEEQEALESVENKINSRGK